MIWNAANRQFYLYFHGENTTTRMAWSTDGVHFTYHGRVLHTGVIPGTTETSYARVFEHSVTGLGNRFVMVFMGVTSRQPQDLLGLVGRRQELAVRPDAAGLALARTVRPTSRRRTCSSATAPRTSSTTATAATCTSPRSATNFDREVHLGVFHRAMAGAPDRGRAAAPSFGTDGGVQYMFYEAGPRLDGTIAVARAV